MPNSIIDNLTAVIEQLNKTMDFTVYHTSFEDYVPGIIVYINDGSDTRIKLKVVE